MVSQPRLPRFVRVLSISAVLLGLVAIASLFASLSQSGESLYEPATMDEPILVFAEFGTTVDEILIAPATNPEALTLIQSVPHADGWGLNPAPEMVDGRTAFTVLPSDVQPDRSSAAELWLLDIKATSKVRLARDADLLVAPILRRDGAILVYRRTEDSGAQSLIRVDLETRVRRVLHTDHPEFGVFPIGFDEKGDLLFTRLSSSGTDLMRVTESSYLEVLLHASDEIARDWSVAPSGNAVAFVTPVLHREQIIHQAQIVLIGEHEGNITAPVDTSRGEQYSPRWRHDGALAIGYSTNSSSSSAPIVLTASEEIILPAAPTGFDVPLGWSVDGTYLAVRHFSGTGSQEPGSETLVVLGGDSTRVEITSKSDLLFLGWASA